MPNYNIIVTEGYKPYTFDEMIKPLQMYKEEYDKIDAELQDINDKASLASYYIDRKKDQDILDVYDSYQRDLDALADSFTSGGMTAEKRAMAKRLRKRYGSEISNILVAAQERKNEIDEQRRALLQNPNLRFSRNAQDTGLSYYYNNPTRDPYVPYDLEKITTQAYEAAKAITEAYPLRLKLENAKDPYGNNVPGWKTQIKVKGPIDSAETILDDISTKGEYAGNYGNYKSARDSILASIGYDKLPDGDLKRSLEQAVNSGMLKGIKQLSEASFTQEKSGTTRNPVTTSKNNGSGIGIHGRVTTSAMGQGLTDRDKAAVEKTLDLLGTKSSKNEKGEDRYRLAISAVVPTTEKQREERANALTNVDERLLGVTTEKLDELWKEYEEAENFDYGILKKDEFSAASPVRATWRGLKAFGRILGRIGFEESSNQEANNNTSQMQYGSAMQPATIPNGGITLRNEEEQKQHVLNKIEKEYQKILDDMLNLPEAKYYYNIDTFTAENINRYFNEMLNNADINTQKLIYTNAPDPVIKYYRNLISGLNQVGNIDNGLFNVDNPEKPLSYDEREKILKDGKDFAPAVVSDKYTGLDAFGIIIDGKEYIIRGSEETNRANEDLNVIQAILRSTKASIPPVSKAEAPEFVDRTGADVKNLVTIEGEEANRLYKTFAEGKSINVEQLTDGSGYVISYNRRDPETGKGIKTYLDNDEGDVYVYESQEVAETIALLKQQEVFDAVGLYAQKINEGLFAIRLITTLDTYNTNDQNTHNIIFGLGEPIDIDNRTRSNIPYIKQQIANSYYTGIKSTMVTNEDTTEKRATN